MKYRLGQNQHQIHTIETTKHRFLVKARWKRGWSQRIHHQRREQENSSTHGVLNELPHLKSTWRIDPKQNHQTQNQHHAQTHHHRFKHHNHAQQQNTDINNIDPWWNRGGFQPNRQYCTVRSPPWTYPHTIIYTTRTGWSTNPQTTRNTTQTPLLKTTQHCSLA